MFFSGMEIAFLTSNKLKLNIYIKQKGLLSGFLSKLIENSDKFIITMLLGNTISLVIYGIHMNEIVHYLFLETRNLSLFSNLLISTCLSTIIIMVTAEYLPKIIFKTFPNYFLKLFSIPAYIIYSILSILRVTSLILSISNFFMRILSKKSLEKDSSKFNLSDLENLAIENIKPNKVNDNMELQMFKNAIYFSKLNARDCMIPRNEIVALEVNKPIKELKDKFVETGFSKILIYEENIENILGYVHSFELFKNPSKIMDILLPIDKVPETMALNKLLNTLIKKRRSISIVMDEYGGLSGLITTEDIIEEIFGEIEDEHDTLDLINKKVNDKEFILSARIEIDQINDQYSLDLPKGDEYETIGGLIIKHIENIPKEGQKIKIYSFQFTITKVSNKRIEEVRLLIDKN